MHLTLFAIRTYAQALIGWRLMVIAHQCGLSYNEAEARFGNGTAKEKKRKKKSKRRNRSFIDVLRGKGSSDQVRYACVQAYTETNCLGPLPRSHPTK